MACLVRDTFNHSGEIIQKMADMIFRHNTSYCAPDAFEEPDKMILRFR